MPEVIQDWLGSRIGVVLDPAPEKFGKNTKDGKLLAKILYSYDIVNADFVASLKESGEVDECLENLQRLKPWLDYLGAVSDKNTLRCMADGHGSAALRVFYSLYTKLENKDKLHYTSLKKERRCDDEVETVRPIRIDWVPEMAVRSTPAIYESPLAIPLIEKQHMIQWHKENCSSILEHIKSLKDKFSQLYGKKDESIKELGPIVSKHTTSCILFPRVNEMADTINQINEFHAKNYCKMPNLTYEELIELEQKARSSPIPGIDLLSAQTFVDTVKRRSRKHTIGRTFQQKMQKLLLDELWRKTLELQEKYFDHKVSENILKQSQYEKQICGKLFLIKHQKKLLAENRKLVEKLIMKSSEKEYDDPLTTKLYSEDVDAEEEELERNRLFELHRRLYREKVRLRYEQNLAEARAIVEALADIAVRSAEYRELHECQVPERLMRDMKELFYHNLPIFDLLEHIESLVEEDHGEEEDVESIVGLELERQDTLDDMDLNDYLYLVGPWMVELLFPPQCIEEEPCEAELEPYQTVLGYVVHKLLEFKYPIPEPPKPAEIKPMSPTAIVLGMNDENGISMLSDLMETRNILVVNVNDAINFVLLQYQSELSVVRDIDINFNKATRKGLKKKGKEKTEKKKSKKEELLEKGKDKKDKKKGKKGVSDEDAPFKEKETQTPRMIPDDDPLLTPNAELGRLAFESLGLGGNVPDAVLIPAIVAYIVAKQEECSGWVLMNYPEFYSQAKYLECLLTGYNLLPIEEEMDTIEEIEGYQCRGPNPEGNPDPFKSLRESRIVPNTIPPANLADPQSYFSAFIKSQKQKQKKDAKKGKKEIEDKKRPKSAESDDQSKKPTEDLPPLFNFYVDQKVFFNFDYSAINFPTMKELAKLIIGDVQVNEDLEVVPKPSLEVFGLTLPEIEEKWSKQKKKPGRETKKKAPKSKKKEKPPPTPPPVEEPPPEPEPPPPPPEETKKGKKKGKEKGKKEPKEEIPEVEPPKPGDPEWVWVAEEQPEEMKLALATLWESMEAAYVADFKQVFFCLRLHHSYIILYITFVRNNIRNFMRRPDGKQRLLSEFQYMFNDIDMDLRPDVEIKCELHVRVSEFEQALMSIIDERKAVTEEYLRSVIKENWVPEELGSLVNHYLCAIQLEADRCFDTCQVVNDYYTLMQQKPVADTRPEKIVVPRLHISDRRYSILSTTSGKSLDSSRKSLDNSRKSFDNSRKSLTSNQSPGPSQITATTVGSRATSSRRRSSQDTFTVECWDFILNILLNLQLPEDGFTPYHTFFNETMDAAIEAVESGTKPFVDTATKSEKNKGKKSKGSKKGKKSDTASPDMDVGERLGVEWNSAMTVEMERFAYRMKLIRERAILDMDEFLMTMINAFSSIADEIAAMYFREIQSVQNCCKVFRCAIEEEIPIQQELQLILDEFIIRHDILLFPDPPPPPVPPLVEKYSEFQFTINQLGRLLEKLYNVAPQGEISTRYFIYILQDLRIMITEDGVGKSLPAVWSSIQPDDLTSIFRKVYQKLEIVNWRDFIIYALELPFPTEGEIIYMRQLFKSIDTDRTELICKEDYYNIELWFEEFTEDEHDTLRIDLAKELLFKMYQVDDDNMNYTAMLLAFCKDEDPAIGFQKALALSMGRYIRLRDSVGFDDNEYGEEGLRAVEEVLEEIINDTIQETEGIILKDYVETPEENTSVKSFPCYVKSVCDYAPKSCKNIIEYVPEEDYSFVMSLKSFYPESVSTVSQSVSLIPKKVVQSILASSYPVIPQLCLLLHAESTLQQSIDAVYESLECEHDRVFAYKLIQHDFMFRLLTSTNKFKIIDVTSCVCELLEARKSSASKDNVC